MTEKHRFKRRVYYNNTDAGGILYHGDYLKFCEQARSELFFQKGVTFRNGGYVIKRLIANYLGSARLGDEVEIETEIVKIGHSFIQFEQKMFLKNRKIFQLNATAVYLEKGKISKIPPLHLAILGVKKGEKDDPDSR